jgi:hypothetical protein
MKPPGDVGTHPGKRLGAGRARLELRQVEDADALSKPGNMGVTAIVELLAFISSDEMFGVFAQTPPFLTIRAG